MRASLIGLTVLGLVAGMATAARDGGPVASTRTVCDVTVAAEESLAQVVARVPADRTVCLRAGVHEWSGSLSVSAPRTTIRNVPGERATMRGRLRIESTATASVISNLTLDGRGDGPQGLSPVIYADRAVLRQNEITNASTGICIYLVSFYDEPAPRGVVIEGNRIHHCGSLPPTNHEHGIYVAEGVGTIIRDNWIHDNADRGIQLYPDADRSEVTGNVIDGNGEGIILGGAHGTADHNLIAHNVIANSTVRHNVDASWEAATGEDNVLRDNCMWSPRPGYFGGAPGHSGILQGTPGFRAFDNVVRRPRYVGVGHDDFRLRRTSRCARILDDAPGVPGP